MSMLQHGLSEDSSGYTVNQSLRFRASNSAGLSRTYTSNATWTFSVWLKRGAMGVISPILGDIIKFNANGTLTAVGFTTTAVFRDPSAWYHIHVSNGGLYVNGISFGTVTTSALTNTKIGTNGTNYFDGYIAHHYFIDSISSSYNNFGITDAVTGIWTPKAFSGSYGTTGGFWPFNDATSLTTLGYDRSGNGNNWTCNGISITAGATYDVMKDSPANGAGEVGNYATLNPLDVGSPAIVSDGSLKFTVASANERAVRSTISIPTSGKYYIETTVGTATNSAVDSSMGMCVATANLIANPYALSGVWAIYASTVRSITRNGTGSAVTGGIFSVSDILRLAIDADNKQAWLGVNTTWYDLTNGITGNPSNLLNPTVTALPDNLFVYVHGNNGVSDTNFGQRPFAYTPPTGFKALHTGNMSDATPVTTSGTFTGNASTDGPCVFINGTPTAMTINGNAVTFATHADKLAGGFKVRSSLAAYNVAGSNTYSITTNSGKFKYARAQGNP